VTEAVAVGDIEREDGHILQELGFVLARVGDEIHGSARIVPEMWVPGTTSLRTSILAMWTDLTAGHLAVDLLAPRVPVTLELDVHVYQELPGDGSIRAAARTVKAGRSIAVFAVEMTDGRGEPVAVGNASFMTAPDPRLLMPDIVAELDAAASRRGRLRMPLAERARCQRADGGVAVLSRSDDGMNASGTVNGGLIALAVEEAALSASPGATLASLAIRYLRPVRVGPAVASAEVRAGLGRVEVRDAGGDDRLAVVATTRTFDLAHRAA
jgi:acyl-coenzyme A thioesterase PaaI-like protein